MERNTDAKSGTWTDKKDLLPIRNTLRSVRAWLADYTDLLRRKATPNVGDSSQLPVSSHKWL